MKERNTGTQSGPRHWKAGRFEWDLSKHGLIMGILNVTPDSFSDGGKFNQLERALEKARELITEGADVIDIGGESTRPGAEVVSLDEEIRRVIPVVEKLRAETKACISVDTSKPEVAARAIDAGVDLINDVTGFRESRMIEVCAKSQCGLVVMHMKGTPKTMQLSPKYHDVLLEVKTSFEQVLENLKSRGIEEERVVFDPGIGFGKRLQDNLTLMAQLESLRVAGRPILMGLSRKSFMGELVGERAQEPARRDAVTAALTAYTAIKGASIHRVHEVKMNREALAMINEVRSYSY